MKKLREKLDLELTKKSLYIGCTIILSVVILMILYYSAGMWSVVWNLITAVLSPLILGGVFCYLLVPMVNFWDSKFQKLRKKEWNSRGLSVLISLLIVVAIISLIFTVIIWSMTKQLSKVNFGIIKTMFENAQTDAQTLIKEADAYFDKFGINISELGIGLTNFIKGIAGGVSNMFFGLIVAIYFLLDGKRISRYWMNVGQAVFSEKTRNSLMQLGREADRCFSGYIRGQAIDALIVGTISSLALIAVGMPYAFLVGMIIGVGNFIPYVGPILGYCSIIIINLTEYNPRMLLIGLAIVAVIMLFDGNVVNPKLLAGAIKVHPLLVVISLLAGGTLGGIVGMLVAVPSGAFIKLQFEKWIDKRKQSKEAETVSETE